VTVAEARRVAVARGWTDAEIDHVLGRLGFAIGPAQEAFAVHLLHEMATASAGAPGADGLDPKLLARISALLAKAESTTFPDEAEALSAKAHELLTRHAIDRAVLDGDRRGPHVTVGRVCLHDPYLAAKATMCSQVATANRCQAVWQSAWGVVTVVGAPAGVEATKLLTASLLRQADVAIALAGPATSASGRNRTRSFRQAFLIAFGDRVGERLQAATAAMVEESDASCGGALLPALAREDSAVAAELARMFPHVRRRRTSISNVDGLVAGRVAGDRADLSTTSRRALRR
jgi:hypothetical protein